MITYTHTSIVRLTLTLLFALALGASAHTATAQPSAADEDLGLWLEEMERDLTRPDFRRQMSKADWGVYGDNLEQALAGDHAGLQQGALRMIILYSDYLTISRAGIHDVVRLYRDPPDDRLRRMAVVALGKSQDPWGLDMLKRSAHFEHSPSVRHTILAVLTDSGTVELGSAKVGL